MTRMGLDRRRTVVGWGAGPIVVVGAMTLAGAKLAIAEPDDASSSATASASANGSPPAPASTTTPAGQGIQSFVDHAWPSGPSDRPEGDDWAKAELLGHQDIEMEIWWRRAVPLRCSFSVLREWVRMVCEKPEPLSYEEENFLGAVWGMAGDLDDASAWFKVAGHYESFRRAPENSLDEMRFKMGGELTMVFPVRQGQAFVTSVAQIAWDIRYDGGANVFMAPGFLVDVSWAPGETTPTVMLRI